MAVLGEIPGLFKADIDAAFRRIPIKPAHRWACGITFRALNKVACSRCFCEGRDTILVCKVLCSQHFACPFGAVGSVHAWERMGAALAHIARVYLKIPMLRYVDDFFAPMRCRRRQCFVGLRVTAFL